MNRSCSQSDSSRPFLQPPHRHDPTSISLLATLSPNVMDQLPDEVQSVLWDLQESTCVAYASYERLQDLIDDRFERLMPSMGPDGPAFSESSWFNYSNQYQAEQDYLFGEALPDWHHKASMTQRILQPFFSVSMSTSTPNGPRCIEEWWTAVHACVSRWLESSKRLSLPEFDDIVDDYLAGRHDAAVYETPELSPITVQTHLAPSHNTRPGEDPTGISLYAMNERKAPAHPPYKHVEVAVKPVDLRKDSGISMVAA